MDESATGSVNSFWARRGAGGAGVARPGEEPGETVAHLQELELGEMRYVLTDRGAAAIGLPPN